MTATETSSLARTAPKVKRDDVAYLMNHRDAVIVLDLTSGTVYPSTSAAFESPTLLVLVTFDDVMAHAATAPKRDLLGRVTRIINLDLYALAARGEIPTAAEVEAVLAELAQLDAEILPFRASGGAA